MERFKYDGFVRELGQALRSLGEAQALNLEQVQGNQDPKLLESELAHVTSIAGAVRNVFVSITARLERVKSIAEARRLVALAEAGREPENAP